MGRVHCFWLFEVDEVAKAHEAQRLYRAGTKLRPPKSFEFERCRQGRRRRATDRVHPGSGPNRNELKLGTPGLTRSMQAARVAAEALS